MIKYVIIGLMLLSSPAMAENVHSWGGAKEDKSFVALSLNDDSFAKVEFHNTLANLNWGASTFTIDLVIPELTVSVTVAQGHGDLPDDISVVVPKGFHAEPASATVEENVDFVIKIYQDPVS